MNTETLGSLLTLAWNALGGNRGPQFVSLHEELRKLSDAELRQVERATELLVTQCLKERLARRPSDQDT